VLCGLKLRRHVLREHRQRLEAGRVDGPGRFRAGTHMQIETRTSADGRNRRAGLFHRARSGYEGFPSGLLLLHVRFVRNIGRDEHELHRLIRVCAIHLLHDPRVRCVFHLEDANPLRIRGARHAQHHAKCSHKQTARHFRTRRLQKSLLETSRMTKPR